MECYFAFTSDNKKQLFLDEEDSKHITKVLRHKVNDEIVVVFQEKKYLTTIVNLFPRVICKIVNLLESNNELPIKVTLVMGLLKEQKFDLVIQKAVELGVYCIVPIQLERSISTNIRAENKIIRWQKIAKAAAKQSNRNFIPEIKPIVTEISDLKSYQSDVNFLAYENSIVEKWDKKLNKIKSITIVVGPEGGISNRELELFQQLNFVSISLGRTILRAETAPLYFLSIINYYSI